MADSTIAWLTSWTPTTDDLLVFYDNADWITKKAAISTVPISASITVWTTTISSGTSWRILYDNAWVVWELPTSGASSVVLRDANQNISTNNTNEGYQTVVSAAGTTTLTVASPYATFITGSTTQSVVLPNATTLVLGFQFRIHSNTSWVVTIKDAGSNTLWIMAASTDVVVTCTDISTANGVWDINYSGVVAVSGKKVSVSNSINIAGTDSTTMTFPSTSDNVVCRTSTDTLTNKTLISTTNTITEFTTTTSSATPAPTGWSLRNFFTVTALVAGATFAAPSGTPVNGNLLMVRIKDNGTAQTLAFNAIYRWWTVALPTTTTISKTMYLLFAYNSADSKWDLLSLQDNL